MINFEFLKAKSLDDALNLLNTHENVRIIAGGTDLVVGLKRGLKKHTPIDYVLDISSVQELKFIREHKGDIEIGPLVTHSMLVNSQLLKEKFPVLVEAAKVIGSTQIRNRGTVGGNICNAAACADLVPPLAALDAEVVLMSADGIRVLPLKDFITGANKTRLNKNEMLASIRIHELKGRYYSYYYKLGRRKALNVSRMTIVLLADIEKGNFKDVRFTPGAVSSMPIVFKKTQDAIMGMRVDNIDYDIIEKIVIEEMLSITGERWSSEYKKPVLAGLLRRALENVVGEAKENGQN